LVAVQPAPAGAAEPETAGDIGADIEADIDGDWAAPPELGADIDGDWAAPPELGAAAEGDWAAPPELGAAAEGAGPAGDVAGAAAEVAAPAELVEAGVDVLVLLQPATARLTAKAMASVWPVRLRRAVIQVTSLVIVRGIAGRWQRPADSSPCAEGIDSCLS